MRQSNLRTILALALVLVLSLVCFAGCAQPTASGTDLSTGGVLCLKVNPEIAITYDADGNVTAVEARNEDAKKILETYTGFEGKACKEVVSELVAAIGDAGYFVEEIEGGSRKIVIEIEPGSALPSGTFLNDVVAEVQTQVNNHNWNSPINIEGHTDYGATDYNGTTTPEPTVPTTGTTAGVTKGTDYGVTDYNDTDYGPNADGVTDYTDYGTTTPVTEPAATTPATGSTAKNTDYGVTDYNDTDYGPNADGVTDYTDYGTTTPATEPAVTTPATEPAATTPTTGSTAGGTDYTDYGTTDYNDTDYGKTDYGTDYGN